MMLPSCRPRLPKWLPPLCCLAPHCALVSVAAASISGTPINYVVWVPLVVLCHRITAWVLRVPPT